MMCRSCKLFIYLAANVRFVLSNDEKPFRIAMVSKYKTPFFDEAFLGCESEAQQLSRKFSRNVTCTLYHPERLVDTQAIDDGTVQAEFIFNLMNRDQMDALAVAALDPTVLGFVIDQISEAGIPVVTFDSDVPNSKRAAYIGTDNYLFGRQLAKITKQLVPTGGTYATFFSDGSLNLQQRVAGVDDEFAVDGLWKPVGISPWDYKQGSGDPLVGYRRAAELPEPPTATISVRLAFVNAETWPEFVDEYRSLNMTHVTADATPKFLNYLNTGYVHGLLGQLPFKFGTICAESLFKLSKGEKLASDTIKTDAVAHVLSTPNLPEVIVDQHLLGSLRFIGYVFFGIVVALAGFRIVSSFAQAEGCDNLYSLLLASSALLFSAVLIPLSIDDGGESLSAFTATSICTSILWLVFIALSVLLATINAKVAKHAETEESNITVGDLTKPLGALLASNLVILTVWAIADPLSFIRDDRDELDPWGRIESTYGACQSKNSVPFLIVLAICNGLFLIWTAAKSYNNFDKVPPSAKLPLFVVWQGVTTGVPLLYTVRNLPAVYYAVFSVVIFLVCNLILYSGFLPHPDCDGNPTNKEEKPEASPTP